MRPRHTVTPSSVLVRSGTDDSFVRDPGNLGFVLNGRRKDRFYILPNPLLVEQEPYQDGSEVRTTLLYRTSLPRR